MTDHKPLIEKLERQRVDGVWFPGMPLRFINPDGPEAANAIRELIEENEKFKGLHAHYNARAEAAEAEVERYKQSLDHAGKFTADQMRLNERLEAEVARLRAEVEAEIVAWLRSDPDAAYKPADAIERGDHRAGKEQG